MKHHQLIIFLFLIFGLNNYCVKAQEFSPEAIQKGYLRVDDQVYFVFSEELYKVKTPEQVVITGSFRGWSTDMEDVKWILKKQSKGLWTLKIENPHLEIIPASAQFKFRINEGDWLSPPVGTPNESSGNLVFMQGIKPPSLRAEIRRARTIWAMIDGVERPLDKSAYRITNAKGQEIKVAGVMPNTANQTLITPAQDLDIRRVYYLEIPALKLKAVCSFDGWFREIYSDKELGANISEDNRSTTFRIFSPRAEAAKLYLYKNAEDTKPYETIEMTVDFDGVWEASIRQNLKGIYYDFTVHGSTDPGNHFYESNPVHISDPYARVSMDSWGKCRVWEQTKPATPLKNGRPQMQDVVAYEVHVQDFTDLLPIADYLQGTIPGMIQTGLKNKYGQKIGFDYLTNLGVNTVHLMPMQEFLHWHDQDWQASFQNDEHMAKYGVHTENYQWGYRTSHCFAVESRFRQKNTEHGAERNQFRDLVQAFHDKDMAVIIDIVPNHTAENMDGQDLIFHFNALDQQYYYRTRDLKHIGEYGNEVKTENRPMVQRWLIDQCKHWIEEFGIDGFRIDLAGQVDQQTLIALRKALGKDIIIYGEPWIGSNDPEFEANPDWDWYKEDSPITFFQDDARNAFKGSVSNPTDKKKDRGYAGGNVAERANVKLGLTNKFPEEKSPLSGINYLDIHDNWALADQFATKDWDGRLGVDEDNYKIATLLLFTSQGPLVLHGGSEMMRSKGAAALEEVVKETKQGVKVYMHGKRDTYNIRFANQFIWDNLGDKNAPNHYTEMYDFWQGLIRFRLSPEGKIFRNAEEISDDFYKFIEPKDAHQLGYMVDNKVLVLINVGETIATISGVKLPAGKWKLIGNNSGVNHQKGIKAKVSKLKGDSSYDFSLLPLSFEMWLKED
jgi:pullulanase/glycogen debranching enzyme